MKNFLSFQYFLSLTFIFFIGNGTFCQNENAVGAQNTQWKTNGNIADSNHFIGTKNEFPVKFRSNNVERFRITSDGNIGIGTSTPEAKLDVFGNTIFRNDLSLPGLSTAPTLQGFEFLIIDATGAVKKGDGNFLADLVYKDCSGAGPIIDNPTWDNGPNKIVIACPQVFVGIATGTPTEQLHVNGNTLTNRLFIGSAASAINSNLAIKPNIPSTFDTYLINVQNLDGEVFHLHNSGELWNAGNISCDATLSSHQLIIDCTNLPYAQPPLLIHKDNLKLLQIDQDGVLHSRTVKVDVYNWPDYVFYNDYKLPTLSDLKYFIAENGHLPNIPSAIDVEKEGLNLGEMNKLLLQKIEEMTLYLIQQEERIQVLEETLRSK